MDKNKVFLILITIIVVGLLCFFFVPDLISETTTLYCGVNKSSPTRVFKNPSKAYPAFAQNYQFNYKVGLESLGALTDSSNGGNISSDAKKEVIHLREKLNQDNIQFENLLKSAFYAYNANPCDVQTSKNYWEIVAKMANRISVLQELTTLPQKKEEELTKKEAVPKLDSLKMADSAKLVDTVKVSHRPNFRLKPNRKPVFTMDKEIIIKKDTVLMKIKKLDNLFFNN